MDLILHHYDDFSNYAEKARLALGYKGFTWHSVIIPPTAPKPDLTPLTGGYRRTPVLQVGADIYCDTRRIMQELERQRPEPTFYPAGLETTANMIAYWAENQLFRPMSLYVSGRNLDVLPDNLQADRSRMRACRNQALRLSVMRRNEARLRSVFKSTGLKHFSPTVATGRPGL